MNRRVLRFCSISSILLFLSFGLAAQQFQLQLVNEECRRGGAILSISGPQDSVFINWSTGQNAMMQVNDLEAGDYNVHVKVVSRHDSSRHVKDTTIYFTIEKEQCPVIIPRYFSPNDDGYNDRLTIGYIENYPEFELVVYNKWGQRVHHQEKTYIPWDGKWMGANLPDGTYYFVLFYKKGNNDNLYKGDITILR